MRIHFLNQTGILVTFSMIRALIGKNAETEPFPSLIVDLTSSEQFDPKENAEFERFSIPKLAAIFCLTQGSISVRRRGVNLSDYSNYVSK